MLVSVIIPAYNIEKYISRCIKSVLEQTYKEIEVIVINDGSTDNTASVVEEFRSCYKNVILINTDNKGVSSARNKGIELSKGRYILFLDGDDRIKPQFVEKMMASVKQYDSDICFGGWEVYDENNKFISTYTDDKLSYLLNPVSGIEACKLKIKKVIWICQGTAIYRKELLDKNNIRYSLGYAYGEDVEFINKSLLNSTRVTGIEYNGLENLCRMGSALNTAFNDKFLDALHSNRNFYNYVSNESNLRGSNVEELLLDIDNDYNNVILDIYKRAIENFGILNANKYIHNNNVKLINIGNKITLRVGIGWRIKYYLFRVNFKLGGILTKYFL